MNIFSTLLINYNKKDTVTSNTKKTYNIIDVTIHARGTSGVCAIIGSTLRR